MRHRRQTKQQDRRGAAMVEFAVCLPILLSLTYETRQPFLAAAARQVLANALDLIGVLAPNSM